MKLHLKFKSLNRCKKTVTNTQELKIGSKKIAIYGNEFARGWRKFSAA